jgi:hypothetical protein
MKLIFLDIDGVMNHRNYIVRSRLHELQEFCPIAVRNLREIIKRTGAKIVLSSTWRQGRTMKQLKTLFSCYDLDQYLIGKTPYLEDQIRGNEIKQFLDNVFEPVESFVILDDDKDMGELLPHLVHCINFSGLTDERREEAIRILGFIN